MKNNKGFIGMGLILAIIAVLIIGGCAYYVGKNSNTTSKNTNVNNSQQENQNTVTNTPVQNNSTSVVVGGAQINTSTSSSQPCAKGDTPWIKVISPNGGETFTAGQQITVKWTSCNVTPPVSLMLVKHDSSVAYTQSEGQSDYAGFTLGGFNSNTGTPDDGIQQITLPSSLNTNLTLGQHYFIIVAGQDNPSFGPGFSPRDLSDNLFTINNSIKDEPKIKPFGGVSALAPVVIYKPKNNNYANLVWVNLDSSKTQITSFPGPGDVRSPVSLHGGYFVKSFGGKDSVPLNLIISTYATYTSTLSLAQMFNLILDMNPILELYDCTNSYHQDFIAEDVKASNLNTYIDNNQLSVKCVQY